MKRRSFTLLELLIASSLFILLLGSFFSISTLVTTQKKLLQEKGSHIEERALFSLQIKNLLAQATHKSIEQFHKDRAHYFYTPEENVVVFTMNQGPNRDYHFGGEVLLRLFFDKEQEKLFFVLWPNPKKFPHHKNFSTQGKKYLLLSNVSSFSCSFLDKEKKELVWQHIWKKEKEEHPLLLEIKLTHRGDTLTFRYPVGRQGAVITL